MVFLVCAPGLFREGLARLLKEPPSGQVHQFGAISDLLRQEGGVSEPDLIVVEVPAEPCAEPTDLRLVRERFGGSKLVLLADQVTPGGLQLALRIEADAYLLKRMSVDVLNAYLHLISLGEKPVPSICAPFMIDRSGSGGDGAAAGAAALPTPLSAREREILHGLAGGHPNKAIAQRLDITEATVKGYVKSVLSKIGAANRTQAAIWAFNNGIVPERPGRAGDDRLNGHETLSPW
jgi:two-component system nitrate/nitrite response regulator NarL